MPVAITTFKTNGIVQITVPHDATEPVVDLPVWAIVQGPDYSDSKNKVAKFDLTVANPGDATVNLQFDTLKPNTDYRILVLAKNRIPLSQTKKAT